MNLFHTFFFLLKKSERTWFLSYIFCWKKKKRKRGNGKEGKRMCDGKENKESIKIILAGCIKKFKF